MQVTEGSAALAVNPTPDDGPGRDASKGAPLPGPSHGWAERRDAIATIPGLDPQVAAAEGAFIEALYDFSRLARTCDAPDAGNFTRLQVALLTRLLRDGGGWLSHLADALDSDLSVLSRLVAGLADEGLVARHQDPHDRRAWVITITPAGADAVALVHQRRAAWWHRILSAWTPHELQHAAGMVQVTVAAATGRNTDNSRSSDEDENGAKRD